MKHDPSEQAGILVLGKMFASLSEALVLLALVRLIGQHDVGVLAALLVVYQTAVLIGAAGFPSAIMYFLPARRVEERRAIAWKFAQTLMLLGAGTGLLMVLAGLISWLAPGWFGAGTPQEERGIPMEYLMVLGLVPLADLPTRMMPNLLVAEQRAKASAAIGIFYSFGKTIATVLPLALGYGIWAVMGALVVFGYLYGGLVLILLLQTYKGVAKVPSPAGTGELMRFAIPLGMTSIVSILNARVDRYLIMLSFTPALYAVYEGGAWQIPFLITIPAAVESAFMPRYRALFSKGKALEAITIWRESVIKVSLLVVPVAAVFVVAAEEAISVLLTDEYLAAAQVFRFYAIWTGLRVAAFGSLITAAGVPRLVLRAAIFALISNLVLSVPLLYFLGFVGPAVGTVLAFLPTVWVYCFYIAEASGLRTRQILPLVGFLKVVGVAAVASGGALLIKSTLHYHAAVMFGLEAAAVLVGFATLGTLTGLIERSDWRFLWGWLRLEALFK